jgi:hypothetical protein
VGARTVRQPSAGAADLVGSMTNDNKPKNAPDAMTRMSTLPCSARSAPTVEDT